MGINKLLKMNYSPKDDEESTIFQRMVDLEQELVDFQQSSKELEEALEAELNELEEKNKALTEQINARDNRLQLLASQLIEANNEINRLSEAQKKQKIQYENEINLLKQKLVAVEILNDDMGVNDRILESELQNAKQAKNELLEKLALVESELENEKQLNAQHRLCISNFEAAEVKPTQKARHLQQFGAKNKRLSTSKSTQSIADTTVDGTFLDINEFLATEPPEPPKKHGETPRSGSMGKIHEHYLRSEEIAQKVGEVKQYFDLKANCTIHVPPQRAQITPQISNFNKNAKKSSSLLNSTNAKDHETTRDKPRHGGQTSQPILRELTLNYRKLSDAKPTTKKSRLRTVMKFFA